ncbi:hypothetical protein NDU88_003224 [Pleurodeles waltl]|uniref:Uncharacterized protein n=1 Tax=Pleurodeles waltl TaxID=8319 RepID=A0AAV7M4L0_PLEWA|nr:hypothetical protein NDU88_003224 [Pleurodeles waltl]
MDNRVMQALQLLREAGRLDLLADSGDCSARTARQEASGVAAAVVACSPTLGKQGRAPNAGEEDGDGAGRGDGCDAAARQKPGGYPCS